MASSLAVGTIGVVIWFLVHRYRNVVRNLAAAKSSGFPVVVMPWNVYSVFWLATYPLWLPLLQKLPVFCHGLWLQLLDPEWAYRVGYKPFEQVGSDILFAVSPSRIQAFVADAEVITQITTRRNDFPKPLKMYRRLDIYGKNVVSTEGPAWRMHRKLTAPSFGDKNNELVFLESLHHAQSLLRLWTGPNGSGNKTVNDPATDTMRFALYVISRAGFDVRVVWPHEEKEQRARSDSVVDPLLVGSKIPPGHKMNYREALSVLLENIMWTQMGPPEYLLKSPFKIHRTVGTAVIEWGKYMDELYEAKKAEVSSGQSAEGMDLFGSLIRGSGILDSSTNVRKTDLQKSDLLGNAFVIMLAGHETTANALHFSLVYLAVNRKSQKNLQEDLDRTLQGKPISEWTFEEEFPRLFNGMAAAVMNETLRLLQPIINIPKSTAPGRPQPVTVGNRTHIFPENTHISLCCAVHRNPKYWPSPSDSNHKDGLHDVDRFRPERWLVDTKEPPAAAMENTKFDDEDLRGPSGADTSAHLFKPVKGSYIPFSDGYRSCIGRRFAQVEILAVFAVIFQHYSVELAVDEFATDAEVDAMPKGGKERQEVWQKAADRADHLLRRTMGSIITLQLRGNTIPIRFVRRGKERFVFQ
ncbi:cytochrome P450 monooxygenase-like protein [Lindgomyces ingoldianus]|uniref:Cytochrome P450 monooxygenase-like protein n=1 Tax=Lindgomyces ingoldianus TaxID=673940 RepID=A0ACB6RHA8_9PLEO|nr:cytochrome P450 monooxygenase-like protein [Lindgomyces ingoldianus]KAF2478120.1 cytochrome P450 monooxygenase-like protein [Lindgomyces ingoldianus]